MSAGDDDFLEMARNWLAGMESGKLRPPHDVHDPAAWDLYWRNVLAVGGIEHAFSDRMSSDPKLPLLLKARRARSILCAGNGISTEATAFALLGFDVTALDLSEVPGRAFADAVSDGGHPLRKIPEMVLHEDGSLMFAGSGPIDPEVCPRIHQGPDLRPQLGGALRFASGDLSDPSVCPGPFDVVIERRTLQLFPVEERGMALERLAARLGTPGTLVTHRHIGSLKANNESGPSKADQLLSLGFIIDAKATESERLSAPRLACVRVTSG